MQITQHYLKSRLHYEPVTGQFTWLYCENCPANWNAKMAGKVAGAVSGRYIVIRIDSVNYLAHTLAWLYVRGEFILGLDHKDCNGFNNIFDNLRPATQAENLANRKCIGVEKHGSKFRVRIMQDYIRHSFGSYNTFEEARQVYLIEHKRLNGEFSP